MNADRFGRAESIFHAALERPAADREAFIAAECGDDAELARLVRELVTLDEAPHALVAGADPGAAERDAVAAELGPASGEDQVAAPEFIGPYRILRRLGEGGMGTVWLAEQDHPRRLVALKVMRREGLPGAHRHRFEREALALGRLRHPGIAAIHDAGRDGDVAYFAMEYVPGDTLAVHVRKSGPDAGTRIAILAEICDAVQHAHEQGVIHRDLKPSNILIDADGRARVLDFGVARIVAGDVPLATIQTDVGQLVGTIPYMSPEQVRGIVREIDARTDIWALGVIGYELLAGRLPHDLRGRSVPEVIRLIADEDPPSLGTLARAHRGDLATIFAKALERRPAARYPSAAALAADLRRHLADEPILARPPSALYQLGKLARRHRAWAAAIAVAALCLMAATAVSITYAVRASIARTDALAAKGVAETNEALARRFAHRAAIAGADARLLLRDVQAAAGMLEAIEEPARDEWEYRHLAARLDDSVARIPVEGGATNGLGFERNGTLVAAVVDGVFRTYDVGAARLEHRSTAGGRRAIEVLPFGSEGLRLLTATGGCVWMAGERDEEAGEPALTLPGDVAFASTDSSGTLVVLQRNDRRATLCRRVGRRLSVVAEREARDSSLSPDGAHLAMLQRSDLVVERLEDGSVTRRLAGAGIGFRNVQFMHDGRRLLLVAEDGSITLLDAKGNEPPRVGRFSSPLNRAVITPDDRIAVIITRDHGLLLWDVDAMRERTVLLGHRRPILRAAISPDGGTIASGGVDGVIRVWSPEGPSTIRRRQVADSLRSLRAAHAAPLAAAGTTDGRLLVVELPSLAVRRVLSAHDSGASVLDLAWSHDDAAIVSVAGDGTIRRTAVATGDLESAWTLTDARPSAVAWSRDGARVAVGGSDGRVTLFDAEGTILEAWTAHEGWVRSVAFSPDGGGVLTGGDDGRAVLRALASRAEPTVLDGHHGIVHRAMFLADPDLVATAGGDGAVRIWNVRTHTLERAIGRGGPAVTALAIDPRGTRLAAASADGRVRVRDLATLEELLVLGAHDTSGYGVGFAAGDGTLISAGQDGRLVAWRAPAAPGSASSP